jgi:hypothetical protein
LRTHKKEQRFLLLKVSFSSFHGVPPPPPLQI